MRVLKPDAVIQEVGQPLCRHSKHKHAPENYRYVRARVFLCECAAVLSLLSLPAQPTPEPRPHPDESKREGEAMLGKLYGNNRHRLVRDQGCSSWFPGGVPWGRGMFTEINTRGDAILAWKQGIFAPWLKMSRPE